MLTIQIIPPFLASSVGKE